MSKQKKQIWIAVSGGCGVSALLFYFSYAIGSVSNSVVALLLTLPQYAGFLICMLLRGGIHSATKTDYALIGVPINAAIYAAVIYIVLRAFGRANPD